jgi:calcineurin-like phosphoesterase family protein
MTTWFTADTHFGHENIIKFSGRPFRSANHMDAVLIENLWAKVGPQDALWVVGDFAFGEKAKDLDWLEKIFNKLPDKIRTTLTKAFDRVVLWASEVRQGRLEAENASRPPQRPLRPS